MGTGNTWIGRPTIMMGRVVVNQPIRTASDREHSRAPQAVVLILAAAVTWLAGCANPHRGLAVRPVPVGLSPAPMIAPPAEAWKIANAYAESREGAEVVLGLGDSMAPLYQNRTLLVIEKQPFETLAPGMTVVFIGDSGSQVAHALIRRVRGGWQAGGVGNNHRDAQPVTPANLLGRVTLAIELTWPRTTMAAGLEKLRTPTETQPTANLIAAAP